MRQVTVKLQENVVVVRTDPSRPVQPSSIWNEIKRVGFAPGNMEIWAEGVLDADFFQTDAGQWPLVGRRGLQTAQVRQVHLRATNGGEDPPRVEWLD